MLFSKIMHIAQQWKGFLYAVHSHYVEPCRKCLRSLQQAPGLILRNAKDISVWFARYKQTMAQMCMEFTKRHSIIDTSEVYCWVKQTLVLAEDMGYKWTVFVLGHETGHTVRRVEKFILDKASQVVTVVTDVLLQAEKEPKFSVNFFMDDMEQEVERERGEEERIARPPSRIPSAERVRGTAEDGKEEEWEKVEEVVGGGGDEEEDKDQPRVRKVSSGTQVPSQPPIPREEVCPIFAIGDADFADIDDLNQMRLALGVGMVTGEVPHHEELHPSMLPTFSKVQLADMALELAHQAEGMPVAMGDATFDQMTEEEQATAAATFVGPEEDVSFFMEIQVHCSSLFLFMLTFVIYCFF
jgi:hypothetical protein